MFGDYCGPNVLDIWLQTITENTWKIRKFDWKSPGIFFHAKEWEPRTRYMINYSTV